jgi:hypothetical protein
MPDQPHQPTSLPRTAPIGVPEAPEPDTPDEDEMAKRELLRTTPSNEKLRELARRNPPPPEYFEGDEEMPFDPIED